MRIDKLLAHSGFGTRKEVAQLIKTGVVELNGKLVKKGKEQVDPETDEIVVGVETIHYQEYVYFMLNKPQGVISATQDYQDMTVIDLLNPNDALLEPHPVGRLDKDTVGLLLLTNDGNLTHQLTSPNKKVGKTYFAEIAGIMTEADKIAFQEGITLDDGYVTLPAQLSIQAIDEDMGTSQIELVIYEGKYHQVKRMVKAVGKEVTYLKRLSMEKLSLDPTLPEGKYRPLTTEEIDYLKTL